MGNSEWQTQDQTIKCGTRSWFGSQIRGNERTRLAGLWALQCIDWENAEMYMWRFHEEPNGQDLQALDLGLRCRPWSRWKLRCLTTSSTNRGGSQLHFSTRTTNMYPAESCLQQEPLSPQNCSGESSRVQCNADRIIRKDPRSKEQPVWRLDWLERKAGPKPQCVGCKKESFDTGDIVFAVDILYVPRDQEFCVQRTYRFCVDAQCLSKLPRFSNLTPVTNALAGKGATQQDIERALSMGLTIEWIERHSELWKVNERNSY